MSVRGVLDPSCIPGGYAEPDLAQLVVRAMQRWMANIGNTNRVMDSMGAGGRQSGGVVRG